MIRNLLMISLGIATAHTTYAQSLHISSKAHADGTKVTIYKEWPQRVLFDTLHLSGGQAELQLHDSLPTVYSVSMRTPYLHTILFSNEGDMSITVPENGPAVIKGGDYQQQLSAFEKSLEADQKAWNEWGTAYGKATDLEVKLKANKESNKYAAKVMQARLNFALKHHHDIAGAWSAYNQAGLWQAADLNKLVPAYKTNPLSPVTYNRLLQQQQLQQANIMTGKKAPAFSLQDMEGNAVTLESLLQQNKYVLVDYWASWCTPCRAANRKLAPLYEKLKSKGIALVSVSVDVNDELWKKAVTADNIPWLQLRADKAMDSESVKAYKVKTLPATFLIDHTGTIIRQQVSEQQLLQL
ncbi:TlpA disulfide reductase family protein [Chitinophaga sp. sic0106]|uniref:TlpA family protein disulfide reductase n=1 Tax=Chitinophaga sp. sic0106 TaxID=2854785 RepID=UPI001C45067D|nr:TlpA disulfide reductase family protein [Chitinophaga sp. sic0106]MBV7529624.1 TlpA family protein disulfide reductase [Chitinophaga sp. sic0106]